MRWDCASLWSAIRVEGVLLAPTPLLLARTAADQALTFRSISSLRTSAAVEQEPLPTPSCELLGL